MITNGMPSNQQNGLPQVPTLEGDPYDPDLDVTLQEGGAHLVRSMSNWLLPGSEAELSKNSLSSSTNESSTYRLGDRRVSNGSVLIDVTFENAELSLKRDLKKQYLALAIGCWILLTLIQTVSLITLHYWEYSPVVIGIVIMMFSVVFYWRYIWHVLRLPFRRMWETPYPFAIVSAVLGSLSQHAMYLLYKDYNLGQLLIVFFLIQSFYIILVASTFQNYMSKWQRFINHRKLCFDALQIGREKQQRRSSLAVQHFAPAVMVEGGPIYEEEDSDADEFDVAVKVDDWT